MRRVFSAVSISVVHIDLGEVEMKMHWGFNIVVIAVVLKSRAGVMRRVAAV